MLSWLKTGVCYLYFSLHLPLILAAIDLNRAAGTENLTTDAVRGRLKKLRADTGITISINGGGRSGPAAAASRARAAAAAGPPATPRNNATSYASGSAPNSTTTLGSIFDSLVTTNGVSTSSSDLPAAQPLQPRQRKKQSAPVTIKTEPLDTPTAAATTTPAQVSTPSADSSGSDVPSSALGPEMMTEVVSPFVTPTKPPSSLRSTTSTAISAAAPAGTSAGNNSAGSQANTETLSTGTKRKRQRSEAPSPSTVKKSVISGAIATVDGLEDEDGDTIFVDTTPPSTATSAATYAEVASASTPTAKNTNKATDANGENDQVSPAAKRQHLTETAGKASAALPRRSKTPTPTPTRPTRTTAATSTVNGTNASKSKTWTDGPDSDSEGEDRWPGKRYKGFESDSQDEDWEMRDSSDEMDEEEFDEGYGEGEGEGESEESNESDEGSGEEVVVRSGRGGGEKMKGKMGEKEVKGRR